MTSRDTLIKGASARSAIISASARVGAGCTICEGVIIRENVTLGQNCYVGPGCILGEPTAEFYGKKRYVNRTLSIGANAVIRSHTVIYAGSVIGAGLETGHRATVREQCRIGSHCRIGTNSDVQGFCTIGKYVRLHSGVFVAQYSAIKDFAWIFPHAVLLNDPHPPSDTCTAGPVVGPYAVIGARAILMPRIAVGRGAVIGSGALVTRDVGDGQLAIGIPARVRGPARDVRCREDRLARPYPWRNHFSRGMPWAGGRKGKK